METCQTPRDLSSTLISNNTKVKHEGTKARKSVGMISNSSDLASGSWERNESAQNKGDDNHEKKKRRNNGIHE